MFQVTLTFDNGPTAETTPMVLDILREHGIRATFFVVGKHASLPGAEVLMRRALAEGHWIGNHTWSHGEALGTRGSEPDLVESEIVATQRLLDVLPLPNRLFRPNGGGGVLDQRLLDGRVLCHLQDTRTTCVLWNSVPRDWEDMEGWVDTAMAQCRAQPWSLVVLHDMPTASTARHLDRFIRRVQAEGGCFRQDFPADCLAMTDGVPVADIDRFVTHT